MLANVGGVLESSGARGRCSVHLVCADVVLRRQRENAHDIDERRITAAETSAFMPNHPGASSRQTPLSNCPALLFQFSNGTRARYDL